jgi:hypothetical protein
MIQNPNTIRADAYRVLSRELGVVNTVAFLRQLESGSGDYTKERHAMFAGNTIDTIAERIKKRKNQQG